MRRDPLRLFCAMGGTYPSEVNHRQCQCAEARAVEDRMRERQLVDGSRRVYRECPPVRNVGPDSRRPHRTLRRGGPYLSVVRPQPWAFRALALEKGHDPAGVRHTPPRQTPPTPHAQPTPKMPFLADLGWPRGRKGRNGVDDRRGGGSRAGGR